jgi:hypothetical protein
VWSAQAQGGGVDSGDTLYAPSYVHTAAYSICTALHWYRHGAALLRFDNESFASEENWILVVMISNWLLLRSLKGSMSLK